MLGVQGSPPLCYKAGGPTMCSIPCSGAGLRRGGVALFGDLRGLRLGEQRGQGGRARSGCQELRARRERCLRGPPSLDGNDVGGRGARRGCRWRCRARSTCVLSSNGPAIPRRRVLFPNQEAAEVLLQPPPQSAALCFALETNPPLELTLHAPAGLLTMRGPLYRAFAFDVQNWLQHFEKQRREVRGLLQAGRDGLCLDRVEFGLMGLFGGLGNSAAMAWQTAAPRFLGRLSHTSRAAAPS